MSPENINQRINSLELRLTNRPDIKTAIAYAMRCWLTVRVTDTPDSRMLLNKANHAIVSVLRKNESDAPLYWTSVFLAIELEHFDNANEMLDTAMGYKQFFKTNEPLHYATLYFLSAYLEIHQKRARSAKKHMKVLEETVKSSSNPLPVCSLMLGMLHLAFFEFNDAYHYLSHSYNSGNRSVLLFYSLYQYYRTATKTQGRHHLLLPVINWALGRCSDLENIINVYQEELHAAISARPAIGERIYQCYPSAWILKEVCVCRMLASDYGPQAYAYYREAEHKQLYIGGLYPFLVKSAFVNRSEHIHHYSMAEYLRTADMDASLKMYVYHLLLTDPAMADLLPERKNEILQFCTYCLENDIRGRMANSLYEYFLTQCYEMRITNKYADQAEQFLFEDLTRFEVMAKPHSEVRYIYVTERERKGMSTYELLPSDENGPTAVIVAVNGDFTYTCFNATRKQILDETLTVRRMVMRANPALYQHFFNRGARDFALLAYLSDYYLNRLHETGTDDSEPLEIEPDEVIPVLEAVLEDKEIAKPYRMQVKVALGSLYYRGGQFGQALACYEDVDENYLEDAYIEQILSVFLQTHEWARAAGLILRKSECVSDRVLFNAVRQLSDDLYSNHHPNLADAAYGLLIRSWFDKSLLAVVLRHYHGSQAEWQALSRALAALSITEPRLDEIILKNSVWMHQLDEDAQKTFVRMAKDINNPVTRQFIDYCAYEMLINDTRPDYDTLTLLEKVFLQDQANSLGEHTGRMATFVLPTTQLASPLLAYGLCHVYLRYGVTTFHSERVLEEALKAQEAAGILFPVFRENREKRPSVPYIEKNQPFIYRSLPNKNVWLYYRIDDDPNYHAQRMNYLRFGLYLTNLALFYNEKLTYYFSEELPTGSITTREKEVRNSIVYLDEEQDDLFFTINNAIIFEQMFKYEQVEEIITELIKDVRPVRSGLM